MASQDKPLTSALQLVVVSPLTRAVETAVAAFGGASPALPGEPLLMEAQCAVEGLRVERPSVSAVGVPPFLACELCREHLGVHPCDRRRPLSSYRKAYPAVDWSQVESEEARAPPLCTPHAAHACAQDVLWTADTRESDEDLALRAGSFLRWLAQRPEQHIAVVTHSSWLDILFRSFTGECSPAASMRLKNWFKNAELRTVILHDVACVGRPAAADFVPEAEPSSAAPAEDPASVVSA